MADLFKSLMDCPKRVIVLIGPARSGKTSIAMELYYQRLDSIGKAGCLMIVPNLVAVNYMRQKLLQRSDTASIISPAITTFSALAANILSSAGQNPAMLDKVQRWLILEQIVADLHAEGQLQAVGSLVGSAGLTNVLDAAIAELKRAAIEPELLESVIDKSSPRNVDLLKIYRRYQSYLHQNNAADTEGKMWLARDILANNPSASIGYENISAIVVDGFTDFTPTQLEMLKYLSEKVDKTLITLPLDPTDNRERLWFWTKRTLKRIEETIRDICIITTKPEKNAPFSTLFDLSSLPKDKEDDIQNTQTTHCDNEFSITFIEAPDIETEVSTVAQAVKDALINGTKSIGIIARELQTYAEPIERIFSAAGISVASRAVPLDRSGVIRYILQLISLPDEYASRDMLAVLKNSYFAPESIAPQFDFSTVMAAQFAIGAANVLGGKESYRKALTALKQQAQIASEQAYEDFNLNTILSNPEEIEKAADLLDSMINKLSKLSAADNDMQKYIETVKQIIDDFNIVQKILSQDDETLLSSELRALEAFDKLLDELSHFKLLPSNNPADILKRACRIATYTPAHTAAMVEVLDALDARSLRFDHVFLLGVNEKVFPQLQAERCLITETDRTNWADKGVRLDRRRDLLGREMLLFYLAATRADKKLTVSCVSSERSGQGISAPSIFIDDLELAARREGLKINKRRISPSQLIPPLDQITTADTLFIATMDSLFTEADIDKSKQLLRWTCENRPETLKRACFGLAAWHNRWNVPDMNAFDGQLDDARLRKSIAEKIPDNWIFSASELNSYANCPWSFFAKYLLHLTAVSEPEVLLEPELRGIFCHEVLRGVMESLAKQFGKPLRLDKIDDEIIRSELAKAVEIERNRLAFNLTHSQLWKSQTEYWKNLLEHYLLTQKSLAQQQDTLSIGSLYFELAFGSGKRGGYIDEKSQSNPVKITVPIDQDNNFSILLAGRIDRVDMITTADGRTSLLAIDYKTGNLARRKDIIEARDLQLPLYIAALEAIFHSPCAGGVYHSLRKDEIRPFIVYPELAPYLHNKKGKGETDGKEILNSIMNIIGKYIMEMRKGNFQILPADDEQCSQWCPYRQICQYSARRAKWKKKDEQAT